MTDDKFMKIDDELFNLVVEYFNINPAEEDNIDAYHGFRNDVIDLFTKKESEE